MASWGMAGLGSISRPVLRLCLIFIPSQVSCDQSISRLIAHMSAVLVKGLEGKEITHISCGHQHSIAMDKDGSVVFFPMTKCNNSNCTYSFVYVWGYNGYCRLGLGNQQDVLIPKAVPQACFQVCVCYCKFETDNWDPSSPDPMKLPVQALSLPDLPIP